MGRAQRSRKPKKGKPGRKPAMAAHGKRAKRPRETAASADKYALYQRAVQSPGDDVEFLVGMYRRLVGEDPIQLREDFCGTGLLAAHWIASHPERRAEGFDIDPEPVAWGREHNFAPLGEGAERMQFLLADVRAASERPPDLRVAFNFSYCGFKRREEMLEYFRAVRADLPEDGIFALDVHGGPECQEEMEEERSIGGGVTYVWEQAEFWPATAEARTYISFEFKDGTSLRRCFGYDWRLWTLPELVDLLHEAGFADVSSWWEGDGEDGEGDGEFEPDPRGENCLSWIAYVIARGRSAG